MDFSGSDRATGSRTYRLGVDIGGTFTDITLLGDDGSVHQMKLPSTPPSFGDAVIEGLRSILDRSGVRPSALTAVVHGTTVATNALLELRGATAALLTTRGFRDVLELGRMRHPSLYDIFWEKPRPLVERSLRLELDERINARGEIQVALYPAQVVELAGVIRDRGAKSVAVCLLNSYVNPVHENLVVEILRAEFPELYVSASCEILPEIKEYERTSTTVVNAYIHPVVDEYIRDLKADLTTSGVACPLLIMQSSGGLVSDAIASSKPVQLVESGPAAGVTAVRSQARRLGIPNVIAFDMGGTTAKASLIESGEPFEAPEYEVGGGMNTQRSLMKGGGYTVRVPSIDIAEVGAGGGSIFWIDEGGAPRVGPRSAGAAPGPACYGRGGTLPTITDAAVVLGYLNPVSLAGGAQAIDRQRAFDVIYERAAQPLGLDLLEAAYGIYTIAVSNMSEAVKAVTSERGRDPRDFVLMAFGGAGPLHAVEMARLFEIPTVIVPNSSGLFSTIGLLVADIQHHDVFSYTRRGDLDVGEIDAAFAEMEARMLRRMVEQGYEVGKVCLERFADLRYAGQSFELRVPVLPGPVDEGNLADMRECFDADHERTYGHRGNDQRIEIVNLRVRATYPNIDSGLLSGSGTLAAVPSNGHDQAETSREAYFGRPAGSVQTPILSRPQLGLEYRPGPLIVEDMDATTVVPPGSRARRDMAGNIFIEVGQQFGVKNV